MPYVKAWQRTEGSGSGNSRNGAYARGRDTQYGKPEPILSKEARNGSFDPQQIPAYARRTDDPETAILTLYRKVNTTREIADLVEKFYGRHYSAATVSDIAEAVQAQA